MNENLVRLLPNPFAVDYIGTDEPIDLYTEKEMLEFAELIIKECANVELYWLSEQDRKGVAGKIKEHFGIE